MAIPRLCSGAALGLNGPAADVPVSGPGSFASTPGSTRDRYA